MSLPPTRIRRLRARVRKGQDVATRLGLERLLVSCDCSENLLSPGAILCIREMRDPLPGTLQVDSQALRPSPRWREALDRSWRHFLSLAAHPARDPSASEAPAVLFSGEAELLACLARAATQGRLHSEWWWPSLLRPDEGQDWTLRWKRRPGLMPWALQHLAREGTLVPVVAAIPVPVVAALLESLETAYGLPSPGDPTFTPTAVARAVDDDGSTHPAGPARRSDSGPGAVTSGPTSPTDPPRSIPPAWVHQLPELDQVRGSAVARRWAALGLLLLQAPQTVRQPGFIEALKHWADGPAVGNPLEDTPGPRPGSHTPQADATPAKRSEPPAAFVATAKPSDAEPPPAAGGATHPEAQTSRPGPLTAVTRGTDAADGIQGSTPRLDNLPGTPTSQMQNVRTPPIADSRPSFVQPVRFTTEVGGLFYLLNVALALRLYADFTEPRTRGLDLSPWDLLDLLGSRAAGEDFEQDPLRTHLAAWAGRIADEPPGERFSPPDVSLNRDGIHGGMGSIQSSGAKPPGRREPRRLNAWMDGLIAAMESRLERALPSWTGSARLPRLIRQRARVETFDSTIQVRFRLSDHPISIRLAGLDRDPGWIPAAGRNVLFVFEDDPAPAGRPQ